MITLKTGVPGAGKTLAAVAELAQLEKDRAAGKPEAMRPVYVWGVDGLDLAHMPLRVYSLARPDSDEIKVNSKGRPIEPIGIDWSVVPDGAICVIDEAQYLFPQRPPSQRVPEHVAWLNTSRHEGVDVVLITQHPKLLDSSVRRLVGKHQHYRRAFGGQRAVVYEWDHCCDGLDQLKVAVTKYWPYPRRAYQWYKSAELHTKPKFALPGWIWFPAAAVVAGAVAVPNALGVITGAASGKGVSSLAVAVPGAASAPALAGSSAVYRPVDVPLSEILAARSAASAPAAGGLVAAVTGQAAPSAVPEVKGCVSMGARCLCVLSNGHAAFQGAEICVTSSREFGAAVPYDLGGGAVQARPVVPVKLPESAQEAPGGQPLGFSAGDYRNRAPRVPVSGS